MQIEVRAIKGRIAREAPNGPFIPEDRFVTVQKTRYITRLLDHHGDIELRTEEVVAKPTKQPEAQPKAESETKEKN